MISHRKTLTFSPQGQDTELRKQEATTARDADKAHDSPDVAAVDVVPAAATATPQLVAENEEGQGSSSSLAGETKQARQQQHHHQKHHQHPHPPQGGIPDFTPTKATTTTTKSTTTEGTEAAATPPPPPSARSCPSAPAAAMVDAVSSPMEDEEEGDDDHECGRDQHHHNPHPYHNPDLSTPAPSILRTLMAHAAEVVRIGMGASPIEPLNEGSGGDTTESGDEEGQQQLQDGNAQQQTEAELGGTANPLLDITMQHPQRTEEQDDEAWRHLRGPWDDDPEAVSSRGQHPGEEARAHQWLMGTELSFSSEGAGGPRMGLNSDDNDDINDDDYADELLGADGAGTTMSDVEAVALMRSEVARLGLERDGQPHSGVEQQGPQDGQHH